MMKFIAFILFTMALPIFGEGEGSLRVPSQLAKGQIVEKAGAMLPLDMKLTDHEGNQITLGKYFTDGDDRPVILTLGYYKCAMLCSLVLGGLVKGLMGVSFKPGKQYRIISVSIDEKESVDLAQDKRDTYLKSMGAGSDVDWWSFHVTTADEVKRLADAVGFGYYWDERVKEYSHGAGAFFITPKGVLSSTIYGIEFQPMDIKLGLSKAADGKIGSFFEQLILSCFHYDPDSHKYGVYIFGVMRICGVLTIVILAVMLLMYFRGERKRIDSLS